MNKLNQVSYRNTITLKGGWLLVKNPCLIIPWIKIFIVVDHGILHYSNIEIDMKTNNSHYSNPSTQHSNPNTQHSNPSTQHNQNDKQDYLIQRDNHNDSSSKMEDSKVTLSFMS